MGTRVAQPREGNHYGAATNDSSPHPGLSQRSGPRSGTAAEVCENAAWRCAQVAEKGSPLRRTVPARRDACRIGAAAHREAEPIVQEELRISRSGPP